MAINNQGQRTSIKDGANTENIPFDQPNLYQNRELSWLQFNRRVLEEAQNEKNPLLERVKFLAIFANNLDEFFMIRVSGLQKQSEAGALNVSPDGIGPAEQLRMIRDELLTQLTEQAKCWQQDLLPKLKQSGIRILRYSELKSKQRELLKHYFEEEIFPTLTPLAIDPAHPFPHISNLSLNLAIMIHDPEHGEKFARLKIPDLVPRLIRIPVAGKNENDTNLHAIDFVFIEDVISANLNMLFQSLEVKAAYPFRITRNADLEIEEDEASDLLSTIQESVGMRRFGLAIRLEVDKTMPKGLREMLMNNLHLTPSQVYTLAKPIGMANFHELTKIERPELKDPPFRPAVAISLAKGESVFARIQNHSLMLYHPYDSFGPVVDFLLEAARDPNVLAIKQTLYRVGANSPIVNALMEARENGKQVAVLVELKARFDEENNIGWAQALEGAGVHVVYGLLGLKTHAKICMVIRRETNGLRRYIHLSTGNYNVVTSRIYSDFSYFTCDPAIGADISDLFNAITGYSKKQEYNKIWVAPGNVRQKLITLIEREICRQQQYGDGYIAFKMNSLVDKNCIMSLYQASCAGVKVDLQVRGICCLKPGIPGVSENIRVTSIVGRFLEHSRIYYFHNGGAGDLFLGSADLMPRNLDRRVEILFPVEDPEIKEILVKKVLYTHLHDNVKARRLSSNGRYEPIPVVPDEPEMDSQAWLMKHRGLFFNTGGTIHDTTLSPSDDIYVKSAISAATAAAAAKEITPVKGGSKA
jgi:polyphosphate kinase